MKIKKLIEIVDGELIKSTKRKINKVKIDSREIKQGDIFIALIGKNKDGHDYIMEAIDKKASTIILSKLDDNLLKYNVNIILVNNTIEALKLLAAYNLNLYKTPIIAITGSLGKTTTKNLVTDILKSKYSVLKSKKSYNNIIGISLTLLNITKEHELVVLEFGMNNKGEISELSKLCKPFVSVITNIAASHIGNLGNKKNILKAKMEIVDGMDDGILVINGLDKKLKNITIKNNDIVKTGLNNILCLESKLFFDMTCLTLEINDKLYYLNYHIPGKYIIPNILLAIELGLLFDVDISEILKIIEEYKTEDSRLVYIEISNNNLLIDDSYNASYNSVKNLLSILKLNNKNKVVILGDILELGKYSNKIHKKIIKKVNKLKNAKIITIGKNYKKYNIDNYDTVDDFLSDNTLNEIKDSIIAIKGSRKNNLELIAKNLK